MLTNFIIKNRERIFSQAISFPILKSNANMHINEIKLFHKKSYMMMLIYSSKTIHNPFKISKLNIHIFIVMVQNPGFGINISDHFTHFCRSGGI